MIHFGIFWHSQNILYSRRLLKVYKIYTITCAFSISTTMNVIFTDRTTDSLRLPYHSVMFKFSDTAGENRKAGKVRGVALPLEYELERLVSNIVNPLPSWNTSVPAHQWEGVDCSGGREILGFVAKGKRLMGSFQWSTLPRSLLEFSVYNNKLSGELDLVGLPPRLISLKIQFLYLVGTFSFSSSFLSPATGIVLLFICPLPAGTKAETVPLSRRSRGRASTPSPLPGSLFD